MVVLSQVMVRHDIAGTISEEEERTKYCMRANLKNLLSSATRCVLFFLPLIVSCCSYCWSLDLVFLHTTGECVQCEQLTWLVGGLCDQNHRLAATGLQRWLSCT